MASTAISAQGTTLQVGTQDATPNTAVANIRTFSGFDGTASEIDVTNLASTAKEYRLGLQDYGGFSFDWHPDFSDAGQNQVRGASASGAILAFKLTFPDGSSASFEALVSNANSLSGGVDATVDGSVTLRITGDVTFAAAVGKAA